MKLLAAILLTVIFTPLVFAENITKDPNWDESWYNETQQFVLSDEEIEARLNRPDNSFAEAEQLEIKKTDDRLWRFSYTETLMLTFALAVILIIVGVLIFRHECDDEDNFAKNTSIHWIFHHLAKKYVHQNFQVMPEKEIREHLMDVGLPEKLINEVLLEEARERREKMEREQK